MATLAQRAKTDPALLRRILANPGLRSKLPASMLPAKLAAKRQTNIRLSQPIVPGSSTTERELARNAKAAVAVQYGPTDQAQQTALSQEQARQRDTSGFYDAYLRQIAQHSANVQAIGQQAVTAGQGTQNAVTGLAQADLTGLQNPAAVSAQARGATAGDLSQMASSAAAVRQALVGSFVNQQAGVNAANNTYADSQANVVAPGQKLGAQAMAQGRVRQAQDAITATAREKGAADLKYRTETRADEAKNVLAQQIAGVNAAAKTDAAKTERARVTETARHDQAQEANDAARVTAAADARKAKEAGDASKPNQYGVPADQWAKWSTSHRQREIDKFHAKGKGKGATGKGPEWLTPGQSGAGLTQATKLRAMAKDARTGIKFEPTGKEKGPGKRLTREEAKAKILGYGPVSKGLKSPALVDAALDAEYPPGYLRASTVRALIAAGYKPSEVARTLGITTEGKVNRAEGYGRSSTDTKGSGKAGTGRPS